MENTDLYKTRSYSGCLRDAFRMMSTNFNTILRHTWMPISLSSAMGVISFLFRLPDKNIHELGSNNLTITAIIVFLATIGSMIAGSWLMGELYSLLNNHGRKTNFKRALALQIFSVLLAMLYLFNAFAGGNLLVFSIVTVLFFICLSPLAFAQTKFVADKSRTLHDLFMKDYAQGWRHFGFIFITAILTGIIITAVLGIIMLPLLVALIAQVFNQIGMLAGDPDGTPSYFFILLLSTSFASMFIMNYLIVWSFLVQYYMYGSIEATDREKEARKKALLESDIDLENN
jgi:hypothetical protein